MNSINRMIINIVKMCKTSIDGKYIEAIIITIRFLCL